MQTLILLCFCHNYAVLSHASICRVACFVGFLTCQHLSYCWFSHMPAFVVLCVLLVLSHASICRVVCFVGSLTCQHLSCCVFCWFSHMPAFVVLLVLSHASICHVVRLVFEFCYVCSICFLASSCHKQLAELAGIYIYMLRWCGVELSVLLVA